MFAVAGFDWVNSESDALVSYDSFSGGGLCNGMQGMHIVLNPVFGIIRIVVVLPHINFIHKVIWAQPCTKSHLITKWERCMDY